ncbi:MAG: DUF6688 family protein [Verrucomicrobiota bacterium]
MIVWAIIIVAILILAIPPTIRARTWSVFFVSAFFATVGVVLPLLVFFFSSMLVPEWKGGARYGWLDSFHLGKLALLPLVLWATAAFYSVQMLKLDAIPRRWETLGLFIGAVVSTVCFVFGIFVHGGDRIAWWLAVPGYVAIGYGLLSWQSIRMSDLKPFAYVLTLAGSVPFWIVSIYWSRKHHWSLPDEPPDCFIVSASMQGHPLVVGEQSKIERRGVLRFANSQLRTFWQFEALWQDRSPRTHRSFRHLYNYIGPRIAAQIRTPVVADIVYFLLKPFEVFAALAIALVRRSK